jgi:uncharacterized protein (DUF1499 family)
MDDLNENAEQGFVIDEVNSVIKVSSGARAALQSYLGINRKRGRLVAVRNRQNRHVDELNN